MTKEIRCPNCGTAIQIDEATYESILDQVKKEAIEEAVAARSKEIEARCAAAIEAAKESAKVEMMEQINAVNSEYKQLQAKHQHLITESAKMYQNEEQKIAKLQNELSVNNTRQEAAIEAAVNAEREKSSAKDVKIAQLQSALETKDKEMKAKSDNIILSAQNKINELKAKIESVEASKLSEMSAQREAHKAALQAKEAEISHYKDFRSRQSIKHLGESLEDHCRIEYESIRTLLPNATFEKDNKVSETGSKGDFIFRENDTTGAFLLSVMFEMKTEEETSTHKHKNEDFLKELDKDRREKDCEYAVLVTTLEPDNDLYNRGIVDVSHKYPKMLIIRPQFFLVLLMILRSVALDKTSLRKKIYDLESQQMSATSLEHDLLGFKDSVVKCLDLATSNREKAIKRLDSAIKLLEDTKDDLLKMEKHSEVAKKKAENVTIQKLNKEYPSIIAASDADNPKTDASTAKTIPETSSAATDPVAQNDREGLGKSA